MSIYWTQTFTGMAFDLLEPKPEMVSIFDVAHSVAKIDRYNGHGKIFYPVGQHSILTGMLVEAWGGTDEEIFDATMHDAIEAYIGDMISPMKRAMRAVLAEMLRHHPHVHESHGEYAFIIAKELDPFLEIENRVEVVVRQALGMLAEQPEIVTKADLTILANERAVIMAPCSKDWNLPYEASPFFDHSHFVEHDWRYWKERFLETYEAQKISHPRSRVIP